MGNKVCLIMLGGEKQTECFWQSYYNCNPAYDHDIIVVHRNHLGLPKSIKNKNGNVIFENKIINGIDIPKRAFGAYRHYFYKYKENYDIFIFISDDVVIKRDYWISDIVKLLSLHDKLGFGSSQIFNGSKKYPHPSHMRAPFWFAKKESLSSINWIFDDDHDGEMKIADQLTNAGYFGIQLGNKIDFAFDSTEKNHISQIIESIFFPKKSPFGKYKKDEYNFFYQKYLKISSDCLKKELIESPYEHIGLQNLFIDIEPFNLLIYDKSLEIAKKCLPVKDIGYNINILDV